MFSALIASFFAHFPHYLLLSRSHLISSSVFLLYFCFLFTCPLFFSRLLLPQPLLSLSIFLSLHLSPPPPPITSQPSAFGANSRLQLCLSSPISLCPESYTTTPLLLSPLSLPPHTHTHATSPTLLSSVSPMCPEDVTASGCSHPSPC